MLRERLKGLRGQVKERVRERIQGLTNPDSSRLTNSISGGSPHNSSQIVSRETTDGPRETSGGDPPVVATLVVEIRSDGSRTIARGALKDELSGERVALEARGQTPMQLATQLAKNLLTTPLAARKLAREMVRSRHFQPPSPRERTAQIESDGEKTSGGS